MNKDFMENSSKEEIGEFVDNLMEQLYEKDKIINTLSDQSKIILDKLSEMEDELIDVLTEMKDLTERNELSEGKIKAVEDTLDEFFVERGLSTSDFYEFVTELKFKKGPEKQDGDKGQ